MIHTHTPPPPFLCLHTSRGFGGNLIICDEIAFMEEKFFKEVVVPLLQMQDSVLACISSLGDSMNFYSRILKKKINGRPAFHSVHFNLACAKCQKTSTPHKCKHMLGMIPPWQSEERKKVAQLLLEDDGDVAYAELMGGMVDGIARVFSPQQIQMLEDRPHVTPSSKVPFIYIAADPNGGGASHFAMCSIYNDGGHIVVSHPFSYAVTMSCMTISGLKLVSMRRSRMTTES